MTRMLIGACAALALCAPSVAAAGPAEAPAIARGDILRPIVVEKTDDLDFGTLVPSALSGVVTIDPASGAQGTLGGVTALPTGTSGRARFVARGTPSGGAIALVGLPPVLTDGNGNAMPVLALTMDGGPLRNFDEAGNLEIGVGGFLQVGPSQAEGDYSGSFTLTILFN